MKRWFLIAAAATLLGVLPHPRTLADTDTQFRDAKATFDAARARKAPAKDAVTQFSALLELDPANPLLAAYRASAVVMQARDAWLPWTKMKYLDDGLADMDRALGALKPAHEQANAGAPPVAMIVRLVAANAFIAVPSFANRGAEGRRLIRSLIASEGFARTPPSFRISALELAISSSTDADAGRATWQQQLGELKQSATVAKEVAP